MGRGFKAGITRKSAVTHGEHLEKGEERNRGKLSRIAERVGLHRGCTRNLAGRESFGTPQYAREERTVSDSVAKYFKSGCRTKVQEH